MGMHDKFLSVIKSYENSEKVTIVQECNERLTNSTNLQAD